MRRKILLVAVALLGGCAAELYGEPYDGYYGGYPSAGYYGGYPSAGYYGGYPRSSVYVTPPPIVHHRNVYARPPTYYAPGRPRVWAPTHGYHQGHHHGRRF